MTSGSSENDTEKSTPPTRKRLGRPAAVGIVAAILLIAAAAAIMVFTGGAGEKPIVAKNYAVYKDDHTMGSPKAPVVMIEYAAPACPHCAHFFTTVFPQMKKAYVDTGKVYYILRVFPILPADAAVEAVASCLPKEKYFPYIDMLFRSQQQWDPEYGVSDVHSKLIELSAKMGVTAEQFDRCVAKPDIQDRINHVAEDGQTKYNIASVPTFVINGSVVTSEHATWPELKARLDGLLAQQ
jgi:protein-disulfide isomerase